MLVVFVNLKLNKTTPKIKILVKPSNPNGQKNSLEIAPIYKKKHGETKMRVFQGRCPNCCEHFSVCLTQA